MSRLGIWRDEHPLLYWISIWALSFGVAFALGDGFPWIGLVVSAVVCGSTAPYFCGRVRMYRRLRVGSD